MTKNSIAVGVPSFLLPVALRALSYRFARETDFPF